MYIGSQKLLEETEFLGLETICMYVSTADLEIFGS